MDRFLNFFFIPLGSQSAGEYQQSYTSGENCTQGKTRSKTGENVENVKIMTNLLTIQPMVR